MASKKQPQKFRPAAHLAASLVILALLGGCILPNHPSGTGTPSAEDLVNTAAAKTVSALGTLLAEGGYPTLGGITPTPSLTATAAPSASPQFTVTPSPQPGTPTPTSSEPCNQASFIGDVTIPDGSVLPPNSVFIKTWELKNTGSCTWDKSYAVVFAGRGSSMSGAAASQLPNEIKPGETARVSVTLRAPEEPGEYQGYWMLRSGDNKAFGTGAKGGSPFFVQITVAESYAFAEHICSAKWTTGAGELPCPSEQDSTRGYMQQVKDPTLEDGESREGLGLLAAPQPVAGGIINARYPAVIVPPESDFRATIGCHPDAKSCYMRFRVTYKVDGGDEQVLGEWNEGYEGGLTEAIRDLDTLAGRSVEFILSVVIIGPPDQARAIWFNPRIIR